MEIHKFNNRTGPNKVRIEWKMPKINNHTVPNEAACIEWKISLK